MQKWEYRTVIVLRREPDGPYAMVADESNKLGDEGWELAGTLPENNSQYGMLIFKRSKA